VSFDGLRTNGGGIGTNGGGIGLSGAVSFDGLMTRTTLSDDF